MTRFLAAAAAFLGCFPAWAQSYTVEPRHTHVTWAVNHFGTSTFRGKLIRTSGRVVLDAAGGRGSVDIAIDATGHSSGDASLDKQLVTADFFNLEKFATATFRSSRIRYNGEAPALIEGELTLIGVTRPVTLTVTAFHCRSHPLLKRDYCGADAVATIKRSEWGMNSRIPAIGDEVRLDIAIEALKD